MKQGNTKINLIQVAIPILLAVSFMFIVYSQTLENITSIEKINKTRIEIKNRTGMKDLSFTTNKDGLIKINTPTSKDIYLGFAISGKVNNQVRLVTIEDYNWTWEKVDYNVTRRRVNITRLNEAELISPVENITEEFIDNINFTLTNLTAKNNNSLIVWEQKYIFDPERPPKLSHTITNNLGKDITDATFWFVFKLPNNFKIKYNGNDFNVNNLGDTRIRNTRDLNLSNINPIIDLGEVEFRYSDLLNNNFVISDFYIGNGSIVNHPETLIGAIGVTKGNSILSNGQTITLDPEVTDFKSPTRTGVIYDEWTNGVNLKTSDNVYATITINEKFESTDIYNFDSIPADADIVGIEITVEANVTSI